MRIKCLIFYLSSFLIIKKAVTIQGINHRKLDSSSGHLKIIVYRLIVTSSFHVLNKEKTMKQTFAPFLSELEATTKKKQPMASMMNSVM